ncbi:mCG1037138, partial [Mus musculus]
SGENQEPVVTCSSAAPTLIRFSHRFLCVRGWCLYVEAEEDSDWNFLSLPLSSGITAVNHHTRFTS